MYHIWVLKFETFVKDNGPTKSVKRLASIQCSIHFRFTTKCPHAMANMYFRVRRVTKRVSEKNDKLVFINLDNPRMKIILGLSSDEDNPRIILGLKIILGLSSDYYCKMVRSFSWNRIFEKFEPPLKEKIFLNPPPFTYTYP